MASTKEPNYLLNQTGAATFTGPWINTDGDHMTSFNVWWSAVAATSGTLSFQGTNDETKVTAAGDTLGQPNPAAASITAITVATSHGTFPTVGTAAANCLVNLTDTPKYIRLKYTSAAGGGVNQFQAAVYGKLY